MYTDLVSIILLFTWFYHIFLVDRLTNLVNTADRRIEEAQQSGEGKVDKLISNMFHTFINIISKQY